ncbi:prephenate dehydrogenase/arogenate dehydrogenase family protein [Ruegeria meonggei]|uniref:prephenate dehydrogenase/arogenate dehydrogenase family protein n=1 Tax=Ruegeria meonggei TaxID=1446476 RepID=UPI0036733DFA
MKNSRVEKAATSVGIIGFGAFGQLIARHLNEQFKLIAYDPSPNLKEDASKLGVSLTSLDQVAKCDVIVVASPVSSFESVVRSIAPICRPGAIIVDVGSVKVEPSEIMDRFLPDYVSIVATHPLFGPQSARNGVRGRKIAICPIRGHHHIHVAAFLRKHLGLHVIMTTPDQHDRDAATVQGITHLIAKVLLNMGPLPSRMTTKSFDLISEAISMVQHDAPEVFEAIENANPYAKEVRQRFFGLAFELSSILEDSEGHD